MKTKTWIALIAAIAAVGLGLSAFLLLPGGDAGYAQISSGGKVVKTVNLRIDQQFTVTGETGGSNTVTVRDGRIAVTEADCPDHYGMERGFCSPGDLARTINGLPQRQAASSGLSAPDKRTGS